MQQFIRLVMLGWLLLGWFQAVIGQQPAKTVKLPDGAQNIGTPINTTYTEYAPTISADGNTLIWEANISGYWKLYQSKRAPDGTWAEPVYIAEINNAGRESNFIGGPFLTYDDNYIFYTSDLEGGQGDIDIWYSQRRGDGWSKPQNVGAPVNTSGYDGFPSLSADGRSLYFMRRSRETTATGGYCYQIYVSHKQANGQWGQPELLPAPVNTDCQGFPRIMADSRTLVFSSLKAGGAGGYDLYKSVLGPQGTWSVPVALSFVNTPKDDLLVSVPAAGNIMYYVISADDGSEDIYILPIPPQFRQQSAIAVQGVVTNKTSRQPIGAKLIVTNLRTQEEIAVIDNDAQSGKYTVVLNVGEQYDVAAVVKGFSFYSTLIDLRNVSAYEAVQQNIVLEPIQIGTTFNLNNITFKSASADIQAQSLPDLQRVIALLRENPDIRVEISAHTDDVGSDSYNLELSQKRANSVVKYLTDNGISAQRLVPKGYGETQPQVANNSDANRAQNRRVAFKVVK